MMVYIASDRPLPLVSWDESAPAFSVAPLDQGDWDQVVSQHFSKPHVYDTGSHEGCACGFFHGRWPLKDDPAEVAASRESMRRLAEYLADAIATGPVELYACWQGEEDAGTEGRATITPAALVAGGFRIEERQLLTVAPEAPGAAPA